jgi:hypothetical protein
MNDVSKIYATKDSTFRRNHQLCQSYRQLLNDGNHIAYTSIKDN